MKKHTLFPSDTLVTDDGSLLFTSAGMNQFKANFLGEKKDIKRAVSCQKCFRTGDVNHVGRTPYHHTFFEMLGNFSFGDYFKKESILYAWEFLIEELKMDEKSLWVSVYKDDNEAYDIWLKDAGLDKNRIVKLDEDSNFWPASAPSMGPNGVCGPCSEIFFDRGTDVGCKGKDCNPNCDCGRFVEIWNLVFTQFNRVGKNKLQPLPQKNIDTGMGLERMACVLQGKESNFEIDILAPVVLAVYKIFNIKDDSSKVKSLVHAIVDHSRAATFAIADGVYPSNEDRGYVIRKIIRKASFAANLLGARQVFMYSLVSLFGDLMGDFYPEIIKKKSVIEKVIMAEEDKFILALKEGTSQLVAELNKLKKNNNDMVNADMIFCLYDTWGFPFELSKSMASEAGVKVDEEGFNKLLKKQQERSRKQSMFDENIFNKGEDIKEISEFAGYGQLGLDAKILQLLPAKGRGDTGKGDVKELKNGEEGVVITDITPFYAESGGQLTDKGVIVTACGEFMVDKVFKVASAILHKGKVVKGVMQRGKARMAVDKNRRKAITRAHTATHLLQAALRVVLGEHVAQQGSLVDEDRFRFDFTHFQALSSDEIVKVEKLVNEYILNADAVCKENLSFDEAKKQGALAFFKDKYDKLVRVVSISDYSKELCGGTHLNNAAEIGSFIIESESSISSGIRRIEALTGLQAYNSSQSTRIIQNETIRILKTNTSGLIEVTKNIVDQIKNKNTQINNYQKQLLAGQVDGILEKCKQIKGISFIGYQLKSQGYTNLLYVSDLLRKREKSLFIFLTSSIENDIFVCAVTNDLVKRGMSSKQFVNAYRKKLGLRGGGKDSSAQGVIENKTSKFPEVLEKCFREFAT